MIEAYAFLAMFTVQILLMSVLHPARLIKYCRAKLAEIPAEPYPQMDAGVDLAILSTERFLTLYRAMNTGIAVLGVLLLGLMFSEVRLLDWDKMTAFYFLLQASPLLPSFTVIGLRFYMVHRISMPEGKRKAVLQRRGLFDFVSPFAVFVAVATYFLFVAFMLYIEQNPIVGYAGDSFMDRRRHAGLRIEAFQVYKTLYRKES